MPLTDTHIRSLKPDLRPRKYFDGGGLFLFSPTSGSKLWRMAYRFDGKSKLLSFGEYPTVSLKDARERREDAKRMLSRGIDPSDHKRQMRQAEEAEKFCGRSLSCRKPHFSIIQSVLEKASLIIEELKSAGRQASCPD